MTALFFPFMTRTAISSSRFDSPNSHAARRAHRANASSSSAGCRRALRLSKNRLMSPSLITKADTATASAMMPDIVTGRETPASCKNPS